MDNRLILPNFSPIKLISIGGLAALLLIAYVVYQSLLHPWLGIHISYQPGKSTLLIDKVHKKSPASGQLKAGDEIKAIKYKDTVLQLQSLLNIEEPAILPTYDEHNAFVDLQEQVNLILQNDSVILILQDREVEISPAKKRPLSSLPFTSHWLIILFGLTAFIIGLNIWSFRRGILVSRILAIAGTGFFFGAFFNAVTLSREIALSGQFYLVTSSISHLGLIIFAFSTLAILWNYPRKLSSFPATSLLYLVATAIWINQTWQITQMPFHAYYFHFLIDFIFLASFAIRQWHKARESVIDQSALQWLLFSLLISLGLTIILFYMPTIYSTQPILPVSTTYFSALLLFLGITMGVIKYRLFNLPPVWMEIWVWVLGGSMLLFIDLALIYLLNFAFGFAFIISAIVVGWIYFPARQWLSVNIFKLKPRSIEKYFPLIIEQLITSHSEKSFSDKWENILKEVFMPLEVNILPQNSSEVSISNNGINMLIPSLDMHSTIALTYKDSGNKLYTSSDARLCQSLYDLTRYTANIRKLNEKGAQDERSRIARDLHDDIAAQFLTLIHMSKDRKTIEKSRDIIKAIREKIYSLDSDTPVSLLTALSKIYQDISAKCENHDTRLLWESHVYAQEITLTPRQHINIKYIIYEFINHTLYYTTASRVNILITLNNNMLHLLACNDGSIFEHEDDEDLDYYTRIETRTTEINGTIYRHIGDKSRANNCITIDIPL